MRLDHASIFSTYDHIQSEKQRRSTIQNVPRNALQAYLHDASQAKTGSGFQRMQKCRCEPLRDKLHLVILNDCECR